MQYGFKSQDEVEATPMLADLRAAEAAIERAAEHYDALQNGIEDDINTTTERLTLEGVPHALTVATLACLHSEGYSTQMFLMLLVDRLGIEPEELTQTACALSWTLEHGETEVDAPKPVDHMQKMLDTARDGVMRLAGKSGVAQETIDS